MIKKDVVAQPAEPRLHGIMIVHKIPPITQCQHSGCEHCATHLITGPDFSSAMLCTICGSPTVNPTLINNEDKFVTDIVCQACYTEEYDRGINMNDADKKYWTSMYSRMRDAGAKAFCRQHTDEILHEGAA